VAPKPSAGGPQRRITAAAEAVMREAVRPTPAITLEDLCTQVAATQGIPVRVPTMCRALQRLGLPRKKSRSTPVNATRRGSSRHGRIITP
jgi:transposase